MKKALMIALAGAALSTTTVWAAGDVTKGKAKSATCAACHGMDGNSANPIWPKLAGQHEGYIYKQLKNFKDGKEAKDGRYNASMAPMVAPLSDEDMQDLAAYYASLTPKPGAGDETLVALGEKIYKGGNNASGVAACAACHGPTGAGNPAANFPVLAGQHSEYTAAQLHAFKKGERYNDAGQMMRNIAANMTDEEIKAVSEYIAGLQ